MPDRRHARLATLALAVNLALVPAAALPAAAQRAAAAANANATLAVGDTCGDPTHDRRVSVTDAISILSAAVDLGECELCECDLDDSGAVDVEDAFVALLISVSLTAERLCPSCEPDVDPCDASVCDPATSYCSTILPGICCIPPIRECVALPQACSAAAADTCECVMEESGFDFGCYCERAGAEIVNVVCAAP